MTDQPNNGAGIVDVHAHWYPDGCVSEVIRNAPGFGLDRSPDGGERLMCRGSYVMSLPRDHDDMQSRLAVMDQAEVSIQILSIGALDVGWAGSGAASVARRINDALAAVCRQSNGRFRFVAALAIDDLRERLDELERAMSMGAVGVGITTTIAGKSLDAPEFRGFWQEAGKRKLLVLVHPTFPLSGPSGDRGEFLTTGYLGETAMAASKVVLAGILEDCAGVRIVWSHLGGGLAMLMDRLDRVYKRYEKCPRPPSFYLKQCFFDTVCTHGPALDCARATFGAGCLVFGTDEPHVPNGTRDVLAALRARSWPAPDIEAALTRNVQRLGIL
jgi:aminocarboxymuconate-semialdehyde decarboxylase